MRLLFAVVLAAVAGAACGKKGPPLTPFIRVPSAPAVSVARYVAGDLYVGVTVPASNIDGSQPASLSEIRVYGVTSLTPPSRFRFLEIATLVATIPVAPMVDPGEPVVAPPDPNSGAVQGSTLTIRDTLTAADMAPRSLTPTEEELRVRASTEPSVTPPVLQRFYMAVGVGPRGRTGPLSAVAGISLAQIPEPPTSLQVSLSAEAVSLQWEPSSVPLLDWFVGQGMAIEPVPAALLRQLQDAGQVPETALPSVMTPTLYNVYRVMAADPLSLPAPERGTGEPEWNTPPPEPLTPKPVPRTAFGDPVPLDERMRCYRVTALRGSAESASSAPVCVTSLDVYPPAAPANLVVAAAEGQITAFWAPNTEPDLGGYIVMRRTDATARPVPLMLTPILESRYVDRDVKAGVQYFYTVVAVDQRLPLPNLSLPSAEQSDTAR